MNSDTEIILNNLQEATRLWPLLGTVLFAWFLWCVWGMTKELRRRNNAKD